MERGIDMRKVIIIMAVLLLLFPVSGCELLGISTGGIATTKDTTESLQSTSQSSDESSSVTQTSGSEIITTASSDTGETTGTGTEETSDLVVYYSDKDGYVVPVTISVRKTYQVAAESLAYMIKTSENSALVADHGLYPILPEGTVINELKIENREALVDFNSNILDYADKTEEYNIFSSVIYVLTGFSTVDTVKIYIDGEYPGILEYGASINRPYSRKDVLINANEFLADANKMKYDIYFTRPIENDEYLVPLSVEFPEVPVLMVPEKMIGILLTDYSEYDLYSQIPQGTKVVDTSIDADGTLEVVLSSEILDYGGGSAREIALLDQLLYTFSGIDGVNRIKLSIDGNDDILLEGTDLSEPFTVSKYINRID
jgi:germination protein M